MNGLLTMSNQNASVSNFLRCALSPISYRRPRRRIDVRRCVLTFLFLLAGAFQSTVQAENSPRIQANVAYSGQKGINGNELYDLSQEQLRRRVIDFVELGVNWVRLDFDWAVVQPHSAQEFN